MVSASRLVPNLPTRTRNTIGVPFAGGWTKAAYPLAERRLATASASGRALSAATWTTHPWPGGATAAAGAAEAAGAGAGTRSGVLGDGGAAADADCGFRFSAGGLA